MRYGVILPGGRACDQLELGVLAEESGWDGVFVWEAAYGVDAWSLLAAIAVRTSRIRIGTLLTPLPWRRPWKVASQVATVDQLSDGRAILTVGLGALGTDLPRTAEQVDLRGSAELLDEGIDLIRGLWSGRGDYAGSHYSYDPGDREDLEVMAKPVQERVPIWVVGVFPRERSMRRALRCDGVVPQFVPNDREPTPKDLRDLCTWLNEHGRPDMEVIAEGETPPGNPADALERIRASEDAGATWWLESRWEMPHHTKERLDEVRTRLAAGPPR